MIGVENPLDLYIQSIPSILYRYQGLFQQIIGAF